MMYEDDQDGVMGGDVASEEVAAPMTVEGEEVVADEAAPAGDVEEVA